MPGLVPGIHAFLPRGCKDVDGRVKPGHDGEGVQTGQAGTIAGTRMDRRAFMSLLGTAACALPLRLVPTAPLVAMLINPSAAQTPSELRDVQAAADKLGQQVRIFNVSTDRDIDAAFATIVDQRIGGLLVQTDQFFTVRRDQLVLLTTRHGIPTVFGWREFAVAGGLISYGTSLRAAYRQVALYAARILKGEKPADLPVQQATAFETVVNLKAARALGVTIPTGILLRADEVIE